MDPRQRASSAYSIEGCKDARQRASSALFAGGWKTPEKELPLPVP